jgi:alpha-beta hydrolase superfamily lysophospholipase
MAMRKEGFFNGQNDFELYFQVWECDQPCGTIVLTHGLAEHSECYSDFAQRLNNFNWNVYAWDLRGHGRSHGRRGYVDHFSNYSRDLGLFVRKILVMEEDRENPLVLFGHSMGGLITALALLEGQVEAPNAVVLSSPEFGLKIKVPWFKKKAASCLGQVMPQLTMWNEIQYRDLTRDEEMIKTFGKDPLRHDKISPPVFLGMLEGFNTIREMAPQWQWPLLLQVGGSDPITDPQAAVDFFEQIPTTQKELHIYNDSLHEIYNDLDKDRVYQDLKIFLNPLRATKEAST